MKHHQFVKNTFKGAGAVGVVRLTHPGLNNAFASSNEIGVGILSPLTDGLLIIENSLSQDTEMAIAGKNAA